MSMQAEITCDHPDCAQTLVVVNCRAVTDILKEMVAHGWYNTVRVVDSKPARCDLCSAHKSWRPETSARSLR